jgi:hypothetical protein
MSALHALVALMAALTNADADGRVVVDAAARTVKFVLLNAAAHFGKARSTCQCLCSSWRRGGAGGRSQARAAARALACLSNTLVPGTALRRMLSWSAFLLCAA